jgi:hypothetical protein
MAGELESTLRSVATKIAEYVEDAATMTVITQFVSVGAAGEIDFTTAKPVAKTVVRLDGDTEIILPMREAEAGSGRQEIDATLMDLHERNVAAATEYRARILNALIQALPARIR